MQKAKEPSFFAKFNGFMPKHGNVLQVWRGMCVFPTNNWRGFMNIVIRPRRGDEVYNAEGEVTLVNESGKVIAFTFEEFGTEFGLFLVEYARGFNDSRYQQGGVKRTLEARKDELKRILEEDRQSLVSRMPAIVALVNSWLASQ